MTRRPPTSTLFPYTTLFRSRACRSPPRPHRTTFTSRRSRFPLVRRGSNVRRRFANARTASASGRQDRKSTRSELQSLRHLVCRLLLEKKKKPEHNNTAHGQR